VLQLLKLPDGTVKVLVEGRSRASSTTSPRMTISSRRRRRSSRRKRAIRTDASRRSRGRSPEEFEKYVKLNKNVPEDA
jgi:ATP-dependent Lon protease